MQMRIADGVWAVAGAGGLVLGLLDGSLEQGWRSGLGIVAHQDLDALISRLNTSGVWTDGHLHVSVAGGSSRIALPGRLATILDEAQTARLQVVASRAASGRPRTAADDASPSRVETNRGVIVVEHRLDGAAPTGAARLSAHGRGVVRLDYLTAAGERSVHVPALDVLVASAEALRDDEVLEVVLSDSEGSRVSVRTSARESQQAAAEAQWLLPALGGSHDAPSGLA